MDMFVSKGYKTAKIEQVHTEPKRLKLKDSGPAKVERRISEVRLFSLVSKLVPLYLSLLFHPFVSLLVSLPNHAHAFS